jgi:hypothetical protein
MDEGADSRAGRDDEGRGRPLRLLALLLVAAACCAGCGGNTSSPPTEVVGTVSTVAEENGEVVAFRVRAAGGRYTIRIEPTRDYGFDLRHLHEHERHDDPVRVRLREQGGVAYALRIDDA